MGRRWRGVLNAWEHYRVDVEGYRELPNDEVPVLTRYSRRGKTSGMQVKAITTTGAALLRVRDGKIARPVAYWDRGRALADLALNG
jgi:ketosteroid isomerase-like protein